LRSNARRNVCTSRRTNTYRVSWQDSSRVDERVPRQELCLREVRIPCQKRSQRHRRPCVNSNRARGRCAKRLTFKILAADSIVQVHKACHSNTLLQSNLLAGRIGRRLDGLGTHCEVSCGRWGGILSCSAELLVMYEEKAVDALTY